MKKVVMLFSAVFLFASLTFAQTPQTQDKAAKPADKTECAHMKEGSKGDKSGCDKKTKAACSEAKKGSSCCPKDAKKTAPATTTPEKK
jgi:hypothetical protein